MSCVKNKQLYKRSFSVYKQFMALDTLRAAGKAIRNSPKAIRKKFGHESPPKHDSELMRYVIVLS